MTIKTHVPRWVGEFLQCTEIHSLTRSQREAEGKKWNTWTYVPLITIIFLRQLTDVLFFYFCFYLLICLIERERKEERETSICCSIYLRIHWLILVCALTRDQTHNLGVSGWCSNQLSYLARANWHFLSMGFGIRQAWVQIPAVFLTSWMTLGMLADLPTWEINSVFAAEKCGVW